MPGDPPILEFDAVTVTADRPAPADLVDFSLVLQRGELALVRFDPRSGRGPIPDLAMGLDEPTAGAVRFQGRPWADARPAAAARRRGRIGRFFGDQCWVYHLDVDENVTLRERHHTRRPLAEIAAEADALARAVGLPAGLPTARPARADPRDLLRAGCVRMLLGSPPLVVFDEPAAGLPPALSDAMAGQVRLARDRGAAVVWLTADPSVWADAAVRPTHRLDHAGTAPKPAPRYAEEPGPTELQRT